MATKFSKFPISALPLPPSTHLLTHNLTPDPNTPSISEFRNDVLQSNPSIQRRARMISPEAHFSFVSPFPLPYPYNILAPDEAEDDRGAYVERWLSAHEAVHPENLANHDDPSLLGVYQPLNRDAQGLRELIGLSEMGLRDCLPHLDVGDAFTTLGIPSLLHQTDGELTPRDKSNPVVAIRQDLIDVLSGHAVLMSKEDKDSLAFAPWSLRYSGHQFGSWAGQLGDGRAITIHVTPHPSDPDLTYEVQLKGSGRTPFSRSADGLAVLRSSIREFLCSEAMSALGIPTTRALALVSLPELPVIRERMETGCVLSRVAPSFLRIGSFEALSPPNQQMFFFGGGQQDPHWDALRLLGEWVSKRVLRLNIKDGDAWGRELVLESTRRNAKMVAGWQAYGFMHGVINTDNVSILGLTIDYGPYAFMDIFDPFHICNHTDQEGRYAYKYQPGMIVYALQALLNALSPLIGAESKAGKAVSAGWADEASSERIEKWRRRGRELVGDEMEKTFDKVYSDEYQRLMRKRLALRRQDPTDDSKVIQPILNIMQEYSLDFHSTLRRLSYFRPSLLHSGLKNEGKRGEDTNSGTRTALEIFISDLLTLSPVASDMDHSRATADLLAWLEAYAKRIESERKEWPKSASGDDSEMDRARQKEATAANPRFILRQWVLEEVIKRVEMDAGSGKKVLAKVLHMACNPFEPWGAENGDDEEYALDPEVKEESRFCGLGDKKMIGFQCSCSS